MWCCRSNLSCAARCAPRPETERAMRVTFRAAPPPVYVGVDIGTQSLKVVVTDGALAPKGMARRNYQPNFPRPGWAEQDPGLWERALGAAIAEALAAADVRPVDVRGLGICGQLDGCIA